MGSRSRLAGAFGMFFILACGATNDSAAAAGGCAWPGDCRTTAPEGAYACSGGSIVRCAGGSWSSVTSCPSFSWTSSSGFSYPCRCEGGCGLDVTRCAYAFNTCGSQSYQTCGSNAHPVTTSYWQCVP
jgi:hypothetical protein